MRAMGDRGWAAVAWVCATTFTLAAGIGAYRYGVWRDEGFSLNTAGGSLSRALDLSLDVEQQPPLYFLALNLWWRLGDSVGFARLLSVIAALVCGILLHRAARRLDPEMPAVAAATTAVVLSNPFVVRHATEARGYALQLAVGAWLTVVVATAFVRRRASTGEVVSLTLIGAIASYLHYYTGLLVAVATLVLAVRGVLSRRQLGVIALSGAILVSPLLLVVSRHYGGHANVETFNLPLVPIVGAALEMLALLILPQVARHVGISALAVGSVVMATLVFMRLRKRSLSASVKLLWTVAGIGVLCFTIVGAASGLEGVQSRYYAGVLPILWLAAVITLKDVWGWRPACLVIFGFAALGAVRNAKILAHDVRPGDWRQAAAVVTAKSEGNATIVAVPVTEALAIRAEARQGDVVVGFPHDYDGTRALVADDFLFEPQAARADLERRVGSSRFWLLIAARPIGWWSHPDAVSEALRFLDENCETLFEAKTRDSVVRQVRLRPLPEK